MKKILLLGLALLVCVAVSAQKAQLKQGIATAKANTGQKVAIEPLSPMSSHIIAPKPSNGNNTDIVTVLPLGSSANAYGYLSNRTYVWADDTLKAITNLHRMGPGATPPSFSGYLAVDKAINMGMTTGDWTNNYQVYAATLNSGGTYYVDAARYPNAVFYNPMGNTDPNNAYVAYFAPNLSHDGTWGGYSYGVCNFMNQADSAKHMQWYNPPPSTYIPDGMTITQKGISMVVDLDRNWDSGSGVYMSEIIYNRGEWDDVNKDFVYTQSLIPLPTTDNMYPADNKIAASPDGETIWIVTLANNGGAIQIGDSMNYYPVLNVSNDGGLTWSDPIAVQMDGPNGITGVLNAYSDYRITQIFNPPYPARDEIPYTTAFDCDLVVDKWGNPHIGVPVGVSAGNLSIATGDSNINVFDIYSLDDGQSWQGQLVGSLKTFRGTFGTSTEDNRTNISINEPGDHVFVTWLDTHVEGVTTNNQPDVFARGFNLLENKITENDLGENNSNNVTYLSDVFQQAYFHCASYYVFTRDDGGHNIPIVTELLSNPNDDTQPVDFKYIPDFYYLPSDYTIAVDNPPFPVGIGENKKESVSAQVYPNPVHGIATLTVNLNQGGNLTIEITNMVGQRVMSLNKGSVNAGSHQFNVDASQLQAGVYFYTIKLNDQKVSSKMVVE